MTESQEREFLRSSSRPDYELGEAPLTVVDLFSGCGGMTLGLAEAAHRVGRGLDVRLAVDNDEHTTRVFKANFPKTARVHLGKIEELLDGTLATEPTTTEQNVIREVGPLDVLVGGPPCQGHSDLNNRTRRDDPRNALYARMARAAELLAPRAVIVENVRAVIHDKANVVGTTADAIRAAGYNVAASDTLVDLVKLGVPQSRRRHLLIAIREDLGVEADDIRAALASVDESPRTVGWAIEDLLGCEGATPFDRPSRASAANQRRMRWLHQSDDRHDLPDWLRPNCHREGGHSYKSVYGKLWWEAPAQTITTGFTSMGQGRYVHPKRPRTLTPHEAARLQYFPDFYDFGNDGRGAWAKMIGNAVPPKLTMELGRALFARGVL